MIEDFDGPDPAPAHRGHVVVVSGLLVLGMVAGYAAVSSPELRGPFATPRPSPVAAPAVQFIPAPVQQIEVPFIPPRTVSCDTTSPVAASFYIGRVYIGGENGTALPIDPGTAARCTVWWGQPPNLIQIRGAP